MVNGKYKYPEEYTFNKPNRTQLKKRSKLQSMLTRNLAAGANAGRYSNFRTFDLFEFLEVVSFASSCCCTHDHDMLAKIDEIFSVGNTFFVSNKHNN